MEKHIRLIEATDVEKECAESFYQLKISGVRTFITLFFFAVMGSSILIWLMLVGVPFWQKIFFGLIFVCMTVFFLLNIFSNGRYIFGVSRNGLVYQSRNNRELFAIISWEFLESIDFKLNSMVDKSDRIRSGSFSHNGQPGVLEIRTTIPESDDVTEVPCNGCLCVENGCWVFCFSTGSVASGNEAVVEFKRLWLEHH